ncbi:hypothetical protein DXG03_007747 [Asterophora parasitica]|uniref:Rho-GAP domain-containing protein n=1 Tax=Asterophora parasitica TaxID=117018 RepID=A0A9P7GFS9_9AGAR|nr:hypothetical protein DXG03_007747 [Asterophora parasitica]
MAVLSLPLSFTNSFWSQDYRRGLEVLFKKLEQGVAENAEIVAFVRARAVAEGHLAISLTNPGLTGPTGTGFGADDGASLLMAFRGLQAESVAQGQAHKTIANELNTLVADPFEVWALGYAERIKQNKGTVIDNWLKSYEQAQVEVSKLKNQYLAKTRRADDAEDDAKFAPNTGGSVPDKYTTSPRMRPVDGRGAPTRTASVSERISQRLKEIQKKSAGALHSALAEDSSPAPPAEAEKSIPKVDKGKGKAVDLDQDQEQEHLTSSPPTLSPLLPPRELDAAPTPPSPPAPMLLAGLSLPPAAVSQLLTRAAVELPLRPVRIPLLGEYPDCFSGEEFVTWLNDNVPGFGGSLDRAEDAARDLTERDGLLRRIGELGNQFEHADDAFYQFRPKAFDLENASTNAVTPSSSAKSLRPEIAKRTGNLVNLVSKVLNNNANGEPAFVRARQEADQADYNYRLAVRKLDRQRLGLEERLEEMLRALQRWETERLRAVKTVLLQYQGTLANLPKTLEPSIERQATLVASYQPENDLTALIERYRTGPFRPDAQVYESVAHDESDVVFGIDLRKWAEGGWHALTTGEEKKELVPNVLTTLLEGIGEAYGRLPNDAEKRKTWIYEVPLPAVHHLREALNGHPIEEPIPKELVAKYDAPVIASAIKLWLLELDPPLALHEGWDDLRRLYPTVGSSAAKAEAEKSPEDHIQSVGAALQRLPRVHLYVLDEVVKHLKALIASTTVEESDEVYFTKLALSIGRTIVRPKVETELSIQDRHPTLLFIDLLKNYDVILPPTINRKKRESERKVPVRRRTRPVDMRVSRSRISVGADAKQLLAAQQLAQNPSLIKSPTKSPELPPLPPPIAITSPPPRSPITNSTESPAPVVPPPPPAVLTPPPPPPVLATPPPPPVQATSTPISPPPPPPAVSRPAFKEPPPEVDDQPSRPAFKEPPPEADESDSSAPSSRPTFVEPASEDDDAAPIPTPPPPAPVASPPRTTVIPPTPQKRSSVSLSQSRSGYGAASPSPTKFTSRSPSPHSASEDQPISTARSTLSRNSSAQSTAASGVRGPRLARGPRAQGGSVSSMVSNFNRNSTAGTSPPAPGSPIRSSNPNASVNRLSGSPVRRPSSVLGRSAAFSRRTMASDAEDDIVEKK